jgi:Gly-Xaa carboxypeptidase
MKHRSSLRSVSKWGKKWGEMRGMGHLELDKLTFDIRKLHPPSVLVDEKAFVMASKSLQNYTLLPQGEKEPLTSSRRHTRWNWKRILQFSVPVIVLVLFLMLSISQAISSSKDAQDHRHPGQPACPQFPAIQSLSEDRRKLEKEVGDEIGSDQFFDKSLKRMQGAVQIPTESFDDMGNVNEDPRWDIFIEFHDYLKKTFPLV